ncbi:Cytochrome P450 52A9 [Colletotrichum orbiculare MAFF 240422]|uniref:Cytochrome P450 52A9 n=1 Tax=Colletotrichum orbiculare (strain 104-T / ATCC 96160 / CBS 514.97 / LARS 414 / MAFF 240422) TaxID=1213857 RepID=A0A484F9Z7_COLOR|nr:Cytochrome P450 52A9 [Colletotrichum orbiculare MAFF 240422]
MSPLINEKHPIGCLLLVLFAVIVLRSLWLRLNEELKIRRHGGHSLKMWPWDPFGLFFTYSITAHAQRDENIKFMWNSLRALANDRNENPQTYEVRMVGQRYIMTADQENVKAMLAVQFGDFGKGPRFRRDWGDLMGRSIFVSDGRRWHDARQRLRPMFARQRIGDLQCFERHVQALLPLVDGEKTVDVKNLFSRFAMDAAADFSMGIELDSLHNKNSDYFDAQERVRHTQSLIERAGPLNWLIPRSRFKADLDIIDKFMEPTLMKALEEAGPEKTPSTRAEDKHSLGDGGAEPRKKYTFVQECLEVSRDPQVLRDEIRTILIAGRDTTATTLAWCFYELACHPEVVRDLRREIQAGVGLEKEPTYEDLKNIKMLSHVLNETLRIYPVAPFNVRAALKDTSLPRGGGPDGNGPVGVPAGTTVVYSTHLLHLNPDAYSDCGPDFPPLHEFHPRRWQHWTPKPWSYIPFHGGPRICLGQQFALMEMSYVLVRVFQRYSRLEVSKGLGSPPAYDTRGWLRRAQRPDVAELYVNSKLRMASEITLAPRHPVHVTFFR